MSIRRRARDRVHSMRDREAAARDRTAARRERPRRDEHGEPSGG
jgi:hypothetical protein